MVAKELLVDQCIRDIPHQLKENIFPLKKFAFLYLAPFCQLHRFLSFAKMGDCFLSAKTEDGHLDNASLYKWN